MRISQSNRVLKKTLIAATGAISYLFVYTTALAEPVRIPANTRVYVVTDEDVSGKKKRTSVGKVVRASVWRDVFIDGKRIIDAGTSVLVRVDSIKGAKIAGIKGKMTLGAYETTLVGDTPVQLSGGYFKKGKGNIALAATLAGIIFLPLIFIRGKSANIPSGTVFDAYTDQTVVIDMPSIPKPKRVVDLSSVMNEGFSAEVLYDELEAVEKPKVFAFAINAPVGNSGIFLIDTVNGESIEALELTAVQNGEEEEMEFWRGEVEIKKLSKKLKKGINTFEISTVIDGERVATEIILDIQI